MDKQIKSEVLKVLEDTIKIIEQDGILQNHNKAVKVVLTVGDVARLYYAAELIKATQN